MKKNILFIVIDSVTNDIIFNKPNSKDIAPFLNELREKSISGDKMYSEAPYTEAALMSLLGSVDTMDNGGYMEKMKNTKSVLEIFQENNYKVFFCNYYPSIYPSYMISGYDERRYIEGFDFTHLWEYRFKYFSDLYLDNETTIRENEMLIDILEDNFNGWITYLTKIKDKDIETNMLNDCINTEGIDDTIKLLKEEHKKFNAQKKEYLKKIFEEKENHLLFKINKYSMCDKVHNEKIRAKVIKKYEPLLKRIEYINFKCNLLNNRYPLKKTIKCLVNKDLKTVKGLLAGYKNSLLDKDLYDRISNNYDLFKNQRSFYTVSKELFKWLEKNKDTSWMSYVHIDDAHFNEMFFTYDTDDLEIVEKDFNQAKEYIDKIPKKYKGSITYDLSLKYCDNIIKNIFEFLENNKLLDNTNVVITADHGFSYYFSPVRDRYVISNYKENYNVPFIVFGKGIVPKKIEKFCSTKDIPTTLLSLANIDKPKEFKGENLLRFDGREYALLEYMGGGCPDILRRPINLGVRTEKYLVVVDLYLKKDFNSKIIKEVYDLKKDIDENNNLKNTSDIESKIKEELQILEKRYNEIKEIYSGELDD